MCIVSKHNSFWWLVFCRCRIFNAKNFHWIFSSRFPPLVTIKCSSNIQFNIWFSRLFSWALIYNINGIVFPSYKFHGHEFEMSHTITIWSCNQSDHMYIYEMFQSCNENNGLDRSNYSWSSIISSLQLLCAAIFMKIATIRIESIQANCETTDRHKSPNKTLSAFWSVCSDLAKKAK